jgi:hypothetical protein
MKLNHEAVFTSVILNMGNIATSSTVTEFEVMLIIGELLLDGFEQIYFINIKT